MHIINLEGGGFSPQPPPGATPDFVLGNTPVSEKVYQFLIVLMSAKVV